MFQRSAIHIEYRKEPVKGFPEYQVDTLGNVYNKNGSLKKYSLNHSGYCIVNFWVGHKRTGFAIHTLVANQFISNDDPLKNQVNHIDGNKTNNRVDNLEWVTALENTRHAREVLHRLGGGGHNKRQVAAREKKDDIYEIVFPSAKAAEEYLGYPDGRKTIWRALSGLRKTAYGYLWRYFS